MSIDAKSAWLSLVAIEPRLGVKPHVLRDCRLRGEIAARRVGSRFVYERASLIEWLRKT
jgi:hypothetical protein